MPCSMPVGMTRRKSGLTCSGVASVARSQSLACQASGALYNCVSRVMRAMQFPTIHGPRTRAEFDINL